MASFFTTAASQKKRKRENPDRATSKRRTTANSTSGKPQRSKHDRAARDESISGSGSEDDVSTHHRRDNEALSEQSSSEGETAAERRLRLAEQYLENIKGEVRDEVGFDAEEVDRDLIAERLQEDVAETKGRLSKYIASTLNFSDASATRFRMSTQSATGVAVCQPYAYTVSKDIQLTKWQLPTPLSSFDGPKWTQMHPPKPVRRRPTKLSTVKGSKSHNADKEYMYHTGPILCVAASSTGKFIATGGLDKKLIVYDAPNLKPLKVFTQHRDAVTSLSFRGVTNQLYSASKDRTVKVWSLDELAYVETLFGHQDEVVDIAAYANIERCVSVGARDRTARVWKVVEETQLVFRGGGGGGGGGAAATTKSVLENGNPHHQQQPPTMGTINGTNGAEPHPKSYTEGSIDRITLIDNETFIPGSDNGTLSLWSLHKKKPLFTYPLAHGLDPPLKPEEASAELHLGLDFQVPKPQPRWITALAAVPLSDLFISGSWEGVVRAWRVGEGKRTIESLGAVGKPGEDGKEGKTSVGGIVNDLEVFQRGERGRETLCIVAAVGTEHRLGRWKKVDGRSGAMVLEVPRKRVEKGKRKSSKALEGVDGMNEAAAAATQEGGLSC